MMKWLHLFFNRFHKKNLKKTIAIYATGLMILIIFGVKGLMITFLMMICFVMGWLSKGMIQAIKDYRLSLKLDRMKFTEMEHEMLKRENKAYLIALNQLRNEKTRNKGGSGARGPIPSPTAPLYDFDQIEEMKQRIQAEEMEEYKR